jgi:hypothetical protein
MDDLGGLWAIADTLLRCDSGATSSCQDARYFCLEFLG